MAPLKIIGAGCGRTGTDSLREALNMLGYHTQHARCFLEDATLDPEEFYAAYLNRETANWDQMYQNYDAACDWPTIAYYKDLYKKYPDAKVILTVRSADSWYESAKKTIHPVSLYTASLPKEHPLYSFGKVCNAAMFDGQIADPEIFKDEVYIKKLYMDHIEDVKRTIPAEKLYVMELGSGWEGLCHFLGKDVPKEPYPKSNSTKEFQAAIKLIPGLCPVETEEKVHA